MLLHFILVMLYIHSSDEFNAKTIFSPNFRTLDLNLLRVFDEVMAERSLTKAAHNLALDPTRRQQRHAPPARDLGR